MQQGLDGATFDYPAGSWTTGAVAGRRVQCATAELQHRFHHGYEPRPQDRHDLALLDQLC